MVVEKFVVKPMKQGVKGRKYYVVESNDGSPISKEISTLKEARKYMKDVIREDVEEFGFNEDDIDYQIVKYIQTEDTIYWEVLR